MKNAPTVVAVICALFLGLSVQDFARANNLMAPAALTAPKGLLPCAQDDPLISMETRVAASLGAQYLSCFRSEATVELHVADKLMSMPREYAFAIRLADDSYTPADLEKLRLTVTAQWKDFQPLSKEFHEDYIAHLNELAKEAGENSTTLASIKPTLVSINQLDAESYTVISIRSYVVNSPSGQIGTTKVNADGLVLRGHSLIRLTMQQTLSDASDVTQLQSEIAEWARATEGTTH